MKTYREGVENYTVYESVKGNKYRIVQVDEETYKIQSYFTFVNDGIFFNKKYKEWASCSHFGTKITINNLKNMCLFSTKKEAISAVEKLCKFPIYH